MRTRKLPSGSWQVTVPIGKDASGKYRYKSFTDKDKKAAIRKAAEYQDSHREYCDSVTVGDAVDAFIASRKGILSPSTMREYISLARTLKTRYGAFCATQAHGLSRVAYQRLINEMNRNGMSPKTIRNYAGLIGASLKAQDLAVPSVSIPRRSKPEYHIPNEEDVKRLAEAAAGTDMEIPITLSVLGLRRGEICALKPSDLDGNVLHISKAVVYDEQYKLYTKDPKTVSSDRFLQIPTQTAEKIRQQGYVTNLQPQSLTRKFMRLLKRAGVEKCRLHDMRHFFVSYCHTVLKLSDAQIQALGGWSTSHVMTEYYRQTMNEKQAAMLVANKVAQIVQLSLIHI